MRFLATILLVCLSLVSAGQAPIIKKVPRLQFSSHTSVPHGFHKLSANEGAEELEETDHAVLSASDLRDAIGMWTEMTSVPRKANDARRINTTETPLYLRDCRILI